MAGPTEMLFGERREQICIGPKNHVEMGAHWSHLANTTERFVHGGRLLSPLVKL